MDTSPTSPYGSTHYDSTSADPRMPIHPNLTQISLTKGPATSTGLDRQFTSPVVTLSEQEFNGTHGHVAATQGFSHPVDQFDISIVDAGRSSMQSSSDHCQISNYYPQGSPGRLQVPPAAMKRSRTSDKAHNQGSRNMGKRRKVPTQVHNGSPEISTGLRSPNPQDQVRAIDDVIRSYSGTSEDALSIQTQVLSIVEKGGICEPQKTQDQITELDPDNTKKPIECDTCHKKMARPCDLKYRISP